MSYSILVIYTCLYMFHTYNLHMLMQSYTFLSYHVSFQIIYIFLIVLINMYLSLFTYHHIAMLCFSYHVMSYTFIILNHLHIHIICFMFHALSYLIYFSCHLATVYYHRIAILCFSYHVMSCTLSFLNHLHILIICFILGVVLTMRNSGL